MWLSTDDQSLGKRTELGSDYKMKFEIQLEIRQTFSTGWPVQGLFHSQMVKFWSEES